MCTEQPGKVYKAALGDQRVKKNAISEIESLRWHFFFVSAYSFFKNPVQKNGKESGQCTVPDKKVQTEKENAQFRIMKGNICDAQDNDQKEQGGREVSDCQPDGVRNELWRCFMKFRQKRKCIQHSAEQQDDQKPDRILQP